MELKVIDVGVTEFIAGGKVYLIKDSLSVERFKWFEKYQTEFGFGRTFKEISDMLVKAVDFGNKGKSMEAWNIVFNLMEGIKKNLNDSAHPAMKICALFFVTADEDLTKWDEQTALTKIKDWNDEGYDVNSFFRIAANLVTGYISILEGIFQNTSELAAILDSMNELKQKG